MSRFSGPLPPALLTNAFANPLEVCAAGVIIMLLPKTPDKRGDPGGEVA